MNNLKKRNTQAGFSLLELMVVIVIFTVVTVTILFNAPSFRNRTSLQLVAQDIAITIRSAQVFGQSSKKIVDLGGENQFPAFGVYFPSGITGPIDNDDFGRFTIFGDLNESNTYNDGDIDESTYALAGGVQVESICLNNGSICGLGPDGLTLIYKRATPGVTICKAEICTYTDMKIFLESTREVDSEGYPLSKTIIVRSNGQIAVIDTLTP